MSKRAVRCAGLVLLGLLALPATAGATNQRVAISNYQWSIPDVQIDLGENVTWYWTGPDVVHSVTGEPPKCVLACRQPLSSRA